ncbi:MAG TPA: cysteine peptidase family C39 domain-containing protein, partial [Bacteroidales bacterium]|nr:cysteine peptidase family C39 domain-containing protein [Bacteroidales bacterium]
MKNYLYQKANMPLKNRKKIIIKQRDLTDCGPACIASIAAFYNSQIPVAKIRQSAGTDQKGTSAFGLIKAFQAIGMTAKGIRCKPEQMAGVPLPAIAHFNIDNKVMHYVVVYKVGKNSIKIMDPASGKLSSVDWETYKKQWSGIMIISA